MGAVCICTLLVWVCSLSPECRVSQKTPVSLSHPLTQNGQARRNSFDFLHFWATLGNGDRLTLLASGQQKLNDSGWLRSHLWFMDLVLPGHRKWKVAVSREMLGRLVLFYCSSISWKDGVWPFHISSLFLNWYKWCVSLKFNGGRKKKCNNSLSLDENLHLLLRKHV